MLACRVSRRDVQYLERVRAVHATWVGRVYRVGNDVHDETHAQRGDHCAGFGLEGLGIGSEWSEFVVGYLRLCHFDVGVDIP